MRAIILLANIGVLAVAFYLGSLTGLLIAAGVCLVLVAGFFAFSMARTEARESKDMKRAMGRNTTLLAGLFEPSKR
ncbi:hypothetical protein QTH97_06165 [Variovorax sp. J22R24]|uniref:hypothetical protein n=1 Tax=Variovorax gracilis TaxID=3053502 RepID=UPI002575F8BD|nr:hypothetical protein [Variovorax sp. J22R24]MDM0104508.1 hypothetical protein [Variovorax sp. J22R24]